MSGCVQLAACEVEEACVRHAVAMDMTYHALQSMPLYLGAQDWVPAAKIVVNVWGSDNSCDIIVCNQ